jgi:tetratricopeptide (TPR) repeat protein
MPLLSRTLCVCAVTLGLCAVAAAPSRADEARDPGSSPTAESPEYDRLLKEALAEFQLGNWTEARAMFERAHELKPSARTLRAIGLSAFEEKSYAEAVAYLTAALSDQRRPLTDAQRKEAEYAIKRSLGYIAQYELEISPENADVRIDSRKPIILDGKLLLDPGKYQLEVTADGYQLTRESIVARPRENLKLRIELSPRQVDGVAAQGQVETEEEREGLSTQQWLGIGIGAAGVVGLGVGAVFGLTAMSKADDAGCEDGQCPDLAAEKLNDEAIDAGNIATVTLIAGAALAGIGAVLFFVPFESEEKPDAQASLRLAPVVSTQQVGAQLGGRF